MQGNRQIDAFLEELKSKQDGKEGAMKVFEDPALPFKVRHATPWIPLRRHP